MAFAVVGGNHASLNRSDFGKEFIDAVVIGEGETTFAELAARLHVWPYDAYSQPWRGESWA